MIISQSGIVDIIPEYNRQLRPIFCVSEGDKNTRMINITVQQAGENFSIPSGASVYVTGKKQDNTIFTYQCTKSGYIVSFQIAEQMSAANGIVLCELQIIENGNPLGSANFVYWVEPSPVQNGTASESDLNVFLEAIIGADKLDHFWANVEEAVTEAVEAIQIHEGQTVIDASLSVSGAAADAKATGDIVRAFMDALVTETTEESTIATCDDAAGGLPLKRLVANIEPTQAGSGDPSPDNVRAISGYTGLTINRTGKNILPNRVTGSTIVNGITWVVYDDGTVSANGTATATSTFYVPGNGVNVDIPNTPVIFSGCPAGGGTSTYRVLVYKYKDGTTTESSVSDIGSGALLDPTDGTFNQVRVGLRVLSGVTANNLIFKPQIEVGITATEYETYNGATYPITFPTAAGTVYGGTLTVNSDGTGALMVDRAEIASYAGETLPGEWISDRDVYSAGATPTTGAQVVYKVATPTIYALSALQVVQMLNGVTNIWTDAAGTLTAEYYANTSLYVEKKVNAQRNMIAGVEEAMIATKNYSVNDLLIVGNTLYKVTAAISSGAALVVGTNVTETTVAEQLLALA